MAVYYIFEYGYVKKEEIPEAFSNFAHKQVRKALPDWNQLTSEKLGDLSGWSFSVRTYQYEACSEAEAADESLFDSDNIIGQGHDFFEGEMQDTILTIALEEADGKELLAKLHEMWKTSLKTYTVWGNATVSVGIKVVANSPEQAKEKAFYELSELTSFDGSKCVGVLGETAWVYHDGEIEYTEAEEEEP